jgi:hypothetical protein
MAQVAAQQALVDKKTDPRALRRTCRHPTGRYRPIPDRRPEDHDPSGPRPDLCRFHPRPARREPCDRRPDGLTHHGCLSRHDIQRQGDCA